MQNMDLAVFMEDYEDGGCTGNCHNSGVYNQLMCDVENLVESLTDHKYQMECLVNALSTVGEKSAADYLKVYGITYIEKVIEVLEKDTMYSLNEAM